MNVERSRNSKIAVFVSRAVAAPSPRLAMLAGAIAALALTVACGGKKSAPTPEPVAECVQYETKLNVCLHRDARIASQDTLLPKSDEERARIRALCSESLKRIEVACR